MTEQKTTSMGGTRSFDVIDIQHSPDVKSVYLMCAEKRQKIEITRVQIDVDGLPDLWIVPDGQVAAIFENNYHPCLCALFRSLALRSADSISFPLKNIQIDDLVDFLDFDKSADDAIDRILHRNQKTE